MGLATLPPATSVFGAEYTPDHPADIGAFPDGVWEIAGEAFWVNPRHLVAPWAIEMLLPWRLWRGGGLGRAIFPEGGGTLDQSALMLDALVYMDRMVARLKGPKVTDQQNYSGKESVVGLTGAQLLR